MNDVKVTFNEEVKISKYIYGQFAEHLGRCIYEGLYVGEDNTNIKQVNGMRQDVVEALKRIKVPVLRWPGGCFADEYHWKDGVGPKEERKNMVNSNWGGVSENNYFGTHEFFELSRQLECEVYVNGNVGSGTIQEMQEWVEYITMEGESPMSNLRRENGRDDAWSMKFFGVGNESWGCGGNMRAEYYSDLYRRYQTYVRQYGDEKIYKIACGPNDDDYHWMEVLMKNSSQFFDGISLHHYSTTGAWEFKGPATNFSEDQWYSLIDSAQEMDELITKHSKIMDKYDPDKRIGLIVDEWGTWFAEHPCLKAGVLFQQNTIRDAMVAAVTFNIFHKHADRVHMANIAQMVNVLQAMILTQDEKMVLTPTYHVFDLYKHHQDAIHVMTDDVKEDQLTYTVTKKNDNFSLSVCNYSLTEEKELSIELPKSQINFINNQMIVGEHMDDHNTFEDSEAITLQGYTKFKVNGNVITMTVPPMAVVTLTENKKV